MRYDIMRSSALVAGLAIALASATANAQSQDLSYTGTGFVHGFGSTPQIFTTTVPALGTSVINRLWQDVNLRDPWAPQMDPRATFYTQTGQLSAQLAAKGGRQVMLGHSMGGLMIREVYRGYAARRDNIAGIITAGTPHQGAVLADSARKMEEFVNDMKRRMNDGIGAGQVLAMLIGTILGAVSPPGAPIGFLVGFLYASTINADLTPLNGVNDLLALPAFNAMKTQSSEIWNLNHEAPDAAVPRANIVASVSNISYLPLRLASTMKDEPEHILIDTWEKGRSSFHKCKNVGYATIIGAPLARKCAWAEKVMGKFDETYLKYSNGTMPVTRWVGPYQYTEHVFRNIPTDGVVSNEKSIFPAQYQGVFSSQPPIVGANHLNMYRIPAGITTMRNAMLAIGMQTANPTGLPLSVSIQGPSSIRRYAHCGWYANPEGGDGGYSYEWYVAGQYAGSGNFAEYTYPGSGSFEVTVILRDVLNRSATATKTVSVSSGAPMCTY